MRSEIARRIVARLVFIFGLLLMVLGAAFLLGTLSETSGVSVLFSFLIVVIGCLCAIFAIKLNKRPLYLFFASFFLMVGFFLFLAALHIIPASLSEAWPLLSVFSGLALLPAGWRRYNRFRSNFVVPACAFVILGCMLMVFSFDMVPFSFKQFILNWWPLLFVLAGILLVLLSLGSRHSVENSEEPVTDQGAGDRGR
ncbi:MAG: DUF5668 domain-containing protein [Treponema sp.]|nr:DUF5668 domain-containing protein [Treponema sp.]